ncbi:MAG: 50S ribosomal protein L11 methyltransferase [Alteromonadaceae bacterium]|nr:50S ribosomal protein L11 methyltransferase [Alteromonadaceae bacterium]
MAWIQLKIDAQEETAERIGDLMSGNGAMAVTFMDTKDTPMYEPKLGELTLWPDTTVIGLFDAETDMTQVIGRMSKAKILGEDFAYKVDQLEDKDWEREWMDNFHPMQFGQRLWICPSWCPIPDPDAVNILLDPGLAFGTGTHPTTSLCLAWLEQQDLVGKTVLDFGCGSGILGIAALKLGAARVVGVDIDVQALDATRDNAKRNGVEAEFELYLPEEQPEQEYDLVIANILAGPLRQLREQIASFCKPNADLVLSGILETQAPELNALYQDFFDMQPPVFQDEWSRLAGTKR